MAMKELECEATAKGTALPEKVAAIRGKQRLMISTPLRQTAIAVIFDVRVNATSTCIRRFGGTGDGENRSMSVVVGMENARKQRLASQVVKIPKILESLVFWLII